MIRPYRYESDLVRILAIERNTKGHRLRSVVAIAALVVVSVFAAACQQAKPTWKNITPTPLAQPYTGDRSAPLLERLNGRLAERHQKVIRQRTEILSEETTWGMHLTWRGQHVGILNYYDRFDIPEPDSPVLYREYSRFNLTLYVIGTPVPNGGQIVVLTALVKPT